MHEKVARGTALLAGASGIAGMIVTSIRSSVDGALAFGLLCVAGGLVLLVLGVFRRPAGEIDQLRASELEDRISALVNAGADEADLRHVVRLARSLEF